MYLLIVSLCLSMCVFVSRLAELWILPDTVLVLLPSLLICVSVWWGQNSPWTLHPCTPNNTLYTNAHSHSRPTNIVSIFISDKLEFCLMQQVGSTPTDLFSFAQKRNITNSWSDVDAQTHVSISAVTITISLFIEQTWCNMYKDISYCPTCVQQMSTSFIRHGVSWNPHFSPGC